MLEYAARRRDGAAAKVPQKLADTAAAWVAAKRAKLTGIMWNAAGIVRNQADLKVMTNLCLYRLHAVDQACILRCSRYLFTFDSTLAGQICLGIWGFCLTGCMLR